ncbi:MAG: prolipoprotein diacylglyceryl transferase [Gloeobacteraceae cyanobacterium ES-bin-144]|nr:prolipoprotein diacylglyceryl transferase [Verrucomicrobiales bacterium]
MHPIAFKAFGLTIYWYGIFAAIGFLMAFGTGSKRAAREGLPGEAILGLAPWIIGGAIIGARLMYVIDYWNEEFPGKPLYYIITIGRSGLVFYGGLIGSSLATVIYCWKNKYPLWKVGDVMAPSVALGHAFGRISCLMTGCCYGRACSMPWAIHFPLTHETRGIGVHPTQIYESVLNFLFFGFLMWLYRRKRFDGQIFAGYLMGYAILRAAVELFRGDYQKQQYLGGIVSPGQIVSLVMFAIGMGLWLRLSGRPGIAPAQRNG